MLSMKTPTHHLRYPSPRPSLRQLKQNALNVMLRDSRRSSLPLTILAGILAGFAMLSLHEGCRLMVLKLVKIVMLSVMAWLAVSCIHTIPEDQMSYCLDMCKSHLGVESMEVSTFGSRCCHCKDGSGPYFYRGN